MLKFKDKNDNKFSLFKTKASIIPVHITGLIMVKNQENNILNSVNSLNKICDHVIVVDTGSTDNTIENINNNFPNVTIFKCKWVEDYALMRNKTLKFLSTGWVFVLDSDETISSNISYEELHSFISQLQYTNTRANIDLVCTTMCRNIGTKSFVRKKNIFKFSKTLKYHGLVHEELVSERKLKIIDTNVEVLNRGTSIKEIKKFNKVKRYTNLLLKQMDLEPNNSRWTGLVSLEALEKDSDFRNRIEKKLQKFIFVNTVNDFTVENIRKDSYLRYNLYRYLFILDLNCNFKTAIKGCKAAIKLYPFDASFVTLHALISMEISELDNYNTLKLITKQMNKYKKNMEMVHEQSQGSEGILDELTVKLLIRLGYYTTAERILNKIDTPIYKENLAPEIKLFQRKK